MGTFVKLHELQTGAKIMATVPAKYKTTYSGSPVFQTDDTYGETRLIKEEEIIEGYVYERPLIRNGKEHPTKKVRCLKCSNGKVYRLDELRNIKLL